jgi:hypothetical protein
MRFGVFLAVKIQVEVFWIGGKMDAARVLQNIGILPQHYMGSQPRRPQLE